MRNSSLFLLTFAVIGSINCQSEFSPFSDPKKQFEFGKYRIYITDEKGWVPYTYGGGSQTVLANPLHILTGDEPQYVSKQSPTITTNKYYHNFILERNGIKINELDLLRLLGLEDERQEIINQHKQKLEHYNKEVELIKKEPFGIKYKKVSPLTLITGSEFLTDLYCYLPLASIGFVFMYDAMIGKVYSSPAIKSIISFGIIILDITRQVPKKIEFKKPLPSKGQFWIHHYNQSLNHLSALDELLSHI